MSVYYVKATFKFFKEIPRKLRLFNCFSRPTQESEYNQYPIGVLDHRTKNIVVEDDGNSIRRQESGPGTVDNSSATAMELFTPARSALSIDDRITLRRAERHDDARSETQTITPNQNERELSHIEEIETNQQGRAVTQPPTTGREPGFVQRHQDELAKEHGPSKNKHAVINDMYNETTQEGNHPNEAASEHDERSALFATETIPNGSELNSRSAVATPTGRFSQASSFSLSAPSWPPGEGTLLPDAFAEIVGAPSGLATWDAYERQSSILWSASTPADGHNLLMPSGSPSRRQQSILLGLESSPHQAHAVVSVISSQAESPVPSVRLRAQPSTESLSTPSEVSVDNDWHGTILDMECKSATGGESVYFQAKLDTFARRDAIAENIITRLGMKWKHDPNGRTFKVLGNGADAGNVIHPLGYVTLSLRVVGQQGRRKFKFYVLADSEVGRAFDCVLGCTTTMKHFLAPKKEILTEDEQDG